MAAAVDYINSSDEKGIYGLYNKFFVYITHASGSSVNLQYRVKVTPLEDTSLAYEFDIDPIDNVGITQPVIDLQSLYFKYKYTGQAEAVNEFGFSNVKIEVGEISGTPPTFQGYDTSDTFYFYNGYTPETLTNNYRIPEWYDTTPLRLAKVQKTLYLLEDDIEILSMPSIIPYTSGDINLTTIVTEFYDSSDSLLSTSTVDLTARPTFSGDPLGYWNFDIGTNNAATLHDGTTAYALVHAVYEDEGTYDTEELTLIPVADPCLYDRYRLCWQNRYGADEYCNFWLRTSNIIQATQGKEIQSDGVDYEAASASAITDVNNPEKQEYGRSYQKEYTLRSDWLKQTQLDALEDLYRSPSVLMITGNGLTTGTVTPVILKDNSYEIKSVKDGLQRVDVNLEVAYVQPIQKQ